MNYPTSLDDGTSLANTRTTGQAIPGSDHNDLANAAIALETKVGAGASVPTNPGDVLTVTSAGVTAYAAPTGGGSTPTQLPKSVTQTAHGLSVGNAIYFDGTNYVKAKALLNYPDDPQSNVVGIVSVVTDANHFTLVTDGVITGLSGLTAGKLHFLSDATAGLLTTTRPVQNGSVVKPVLFALGTTSGEIRVSNGAINVVARPWARMGINVGYSTQSDMAKFAADLRYLGRYTNLLRITIPSWNDSTGITNVRAMILQAQAMGFKTTYGITAAGTGHNAAYVDSWLAQVNTEAAWADANGVDLFHIGNEEDWWATIGGITGYTATQIQTMVLAKAATLKGLYPNLKLCYSTAEGEFAAWDAIGAGGNVNWQYLDKFGINMYNADFTGTLNYALSLGFGSKLFLTEWADNQTYVGGGYSAATYKADLLARRQAIESKGVEAYFFCWDWGGSYSTSSDWGLSNGDNTYKPGLEQIFSIPR